jgi:hypothetical protein
MAERITELGRILLLLDLPPPENLQFLLRQRHSTHLGGVTAIFVWTHVADLRDLS